MVTHLQWHFFALLPAGFLHFLRSVCGWQGVSDPTPASLYHQSVPVSSLLHRAAVSGVMAGDLSPPESQKRLWALQDTVSQERESGFCFPLPELNCILLGEKQRGEIVLKKLKEKKKLPLPHSSAAGPWCCKKQEARLSLTALMNQQLPGNWHLPTSK